MTNPDFDPRDDLREMLFDQLCNLLDTLSDYPQVEHVDMTYTLCPDPENPSDNHRRSYGFAVDIPRKNIIVRKHNNHGNENKNDAPDTGLYPDGRDFEPDRDSIG